MLPALKAALPAMTTKAVEMVRRLEKQLLELPQIEIVTEHVIHGGMYVRTICIPAGITLTGVLIKIPTMLFFHGHATVYIGGESIELCGFNVLPASAGRKQAFLAHADSYLSMAFPTTAKTVEEAEAEFTDEIELLASRHMPDQNITIITGE